MKSAKAMFRELKYKQRFDTINFISYEKQLKNKLIVIHFDNKKKKVSKFKAGLSIYYQDREDVEISLKELRAINKQVEELWGGNNDLFS